MTLKQKIHQHYLQQVQDNIEVFREMIVALTEESKNEAKSSAGDQHEIALAMMHLFLSKTLNTVEKNEYWATIYYIERILE
jgi:uncharacterized protein with gpF-like domain